jgi:hypothetical protein
MGDGQAVPYPDHGLNLEMKCMSDPTSINCAEACVNGCVLGEQCPHRAYAAAASKFIQQTSIDRMLEIAEESVRKKFVQTTDALPDPQRDF